MRTEQQRRIDVLVEDVGSRLASGGIRVVTLAALYNLVQREAVKRGVLGPGWSALVDTLERLDGYDVSGYENYTVTLPGLGTTVENLTTVVRRVLDGLAVWYHDGSPERDASKVIDWARDSLNAALPERKETICCEDGSESNSG